MTSHENKEYYHRTNFGFVGCPVHLVSLRDKHERPIILDKTLPNVCLRLQILFTCNYK